MKGVSNRIIKFIEHLNISNYKFANYLGISQALISKLTQGNDVNFRADFLEKLILKYPEVNISWLLTGKGDMLNTSAQDTQSLPIDNRVIDEVNAEAKLIGYNPTDLLLYSTLDIKALKKYLLYYKDTLLEIHNVRKNLNEAILKLNAPDFIIDKFEARTPREWDYFENDYKEHLANKDKKTELLMKVLIYKNEADHSLSMLGLYANYINKYHDFFNEMPAKKNDD